MKKLYEEIKKVNEMKNSSQKRKEFNDEMVKKTMEFQRKFGFELNPREGHELWNVEGDAFKHAFGSAYMSLNMGQWGSTIGGIDHENRTQNNPKGEWNMDSWNNDQGRKIVNEIRKEYGNKFDKLSDKEKDALIATKVIMKMRNGELITKPSDRREYKGAIEKLFNIGNPTGYATPIPTQPFTGEQIGKMTPEEFTQNEQYIMEQLKDGLIKPQSEQQKDYSGYVNPISGNSKIFSREDISNLSGQEYSTFEKEIMAQLNSIGVPTNNDLQFASSKGGTVYVRPYTKDDGTEVRGYYRALPV